MSKTNNLRRYHEPESPVTAYVIVLAILMFFVVVLALALWQPWSPSSTTSATGFEQIRPGPVPTPLSSTAVYRRPSTPSTEATKTKIVGSEDSGYEDENGSATLVDDASEKVDAVRHRSAVVKPAKN